MAIVSSRFYLTMTNIWQDFSKFRQRKKKKKVGAWRRYQKIQEDVTLHMSSYWAHKWASQKFNPQLQTLSTAGLVFICAFNARCKKKKEIKGPQLLRQWYNKSNILTNLRICGLELSFQILLKLIEKLCLFIYKPLWSYWTRDDRRRLITRAYPRTSCSGELKEVIFKS